MNGLAGPGTTGNDRGQLLLIAGLTMAIIVLGLVVAFNGVLYSQTTAAGGASEEMDDIEMVEYEIEQAIAGFVTTIPEGKRVHPNCGPAADPSVNYCIRDEIGDLEDHLGEGYMVVKSNERSASLNIDTIDVIDSSNDIDEIIVYYTYQSDHAFVDGEVVVDADELDFPDGD